MIKWSVSDSHFSLKLTNEIANSEKIRRLGKQHASVVYFSPEGRPIAWQWRLSKTHEFWR